MSKSRKPKNLKLQKNIRLRRKLAGIVSTQRQIDIQLDRILRDMKRVGWIFERVPLGQRILLHPKIAALVNKEVAKGYSGRQRTTDDEIVNEILWLALRHGDISKHYRK